MQLSHRFDELLKIDPGAAIVSVWIELESTIRAAAQRLELSVPIGCTIFAIVEKFKFDGFITAEHARIIHELRNLRNMAAHGGTGQTIGATDAFRFAELANGLGRYFENLQRK